MSNKETQYTGLYGPYASGKHYLGDTITYGLAQKATVIWSFRNEQNDIVYVVDDQTGFPFELKESSLSSEELERKKYLHMIDVSDVMPVHRIPVLLDCQVVGCANMTSQAIITSTNRLWSLQPRCSTCLIASGHTPLLAPGEE